MKAPAAPEGTTSAAVESAPIVAVGKLPAKLGTVTAEVLARLLAGEKLTGLDGVYAASTTRLSAVTHYLITEYGWRIEATDKATGCKDGRVAWVSEYALSAATRAAAMESGAAEWCASVRRARAGLRALAAQAKRNAARSNLAPKGRHDHGQWGLFETEGCAA